MKTIRSGDDLYFTETMAEVLEKQGYLEDALFIYKILSDSTPGNQSIKSKMDALRQQAERGRKRAN